MALTPVAANPVTYFVVYDGTDSSDWQTFFTEWGDVSAPGAHETAVTFDSAGAHITVTYPDGSADKTDVFTGDALEIDSTKLPAVAPAQLLTLHMSNTQARINWSPASPWPH